MTLYIDLGNTNLKVGFIEDEKWNISIFNLKEQNYIYELKKILKKHKFYDVWISSTNPQKENPILSTLKEINIHFIEKGIKTKLDIQFHNLKEVGTDIIANAVFASTQYSNTILFSFGTALVVSHIKDNKLKGAAIFLGIQSSLDALSADAGKIGDIKIINEDNILGRDTVEAVSAGFLNSYKFIIEGFIKSIDPTANIIITGGGSKVMANNFTYPVIEETVLKGLYEIAKMN